jgi:hypothetical protein
MAAPSTCGNFGSGLICQLSNVDPAHAITLVVRPTHGVSFGSELYRVLPTSNYDPDDEPWEFSLAASFAS